MDLIALARETMRSTLLSLLWSTVADRLVYGCDVFCDRATDLEGRDFKLVGRLYDCTGESDGLELVSDASQGKWEAWMG